MPSPFSLGVQNADRNFDLFADGDITFFNASQTTAQTVGGVAHGLSGAPDFVLLSSNQPIADARLAWSADATTITFTSVDTQAPKTISVLAGNLS